MLKTRIEGVAAVVLAAVTCAHAQDAVQWRVEDGGNGHWYRMATTTDESGIDDYRQAAESAGGNLASINTAEESLFVLGLLEGSFQSYVLGGIQLRTAEEPFGDWTWMDGSDWSYTNWLAGEPNDFDGLEDFLAANPDGRWNDAPAAVTLPRFAIEWSADCNGDGIVDYGQILDGILLDRDNNGVPDCCGELDEPGWILLADYGFDFSAQQGNNGWRYQFDHPSQGTDVSDLPNWNLESLYWYRDCGPLCYPRATARIIHPGVASDERCIVTWESKDPLAARVVFSATLEGCGSGVTVDLLVDGAAIETRSVSPGSGVNFDAVVSVGRSVGIRVDRNGSGHCDQLTMNDLRVLAPDCNDDCVPDYLQILDGTYADEDGNGVPDCCESDCSGDLNGDDSVGPPDLGILLAVWGTDGGKISGADLNGDGIVNAADLGLLVGAWGDCGCN